MTDDERESKLAELRLARIHFVYPYNPPSDKFFAFMISFYAVTFLCFTAAMAWITFFR